jgi:hypothetical protein
LKSSMRWKSRAKMPCQANHSAAEKSLQPPFSISRLSPALFD